MIKYIVAVAVALGAVGLLAQEAAAYQRVEIKQKCNSQCLQRACAANGGDFYSAGSDNVCWNTSKDITVVCDQKGNCRGYLPRQTPFGSRGGSLNDVLKGGAGAASTGQPTGKGVKGTTLGPKQPSVRAPSAPMDVKSTQGPSPTAPILKGGGKR
jgi:hypothetical protein